MCVSAVLTMSILSVLCVTGLYCIKKLWCLLCLYLNIMVLYCAYCAYYVNIVCSISLYRAYYVVTMQKKMTAYYVLTVCTVFVWSLRFSIPFWYCDGKLFFIKVTTCNQVSVIHLCPQVICQKALIEGRR